MKLHDYKYKENLRGDNLLIIIIDLGNDDLIFNNVYSEINFRNSDFFNV